MVFRFAAAAPLRGLFIGACACVVGAGLAVGSSVAAGPAALVWLGALILLAGVIVAALALRARRLSAASMELTDAGWRLVNRHGQHSGRWADVVRVSTDDSEQRLVLHTDAGETEIVRPDGRHGRASWERLLAEVGRRLDADRGYRSSLRG